MRTLIIQYQQNEPTGKCEYKIFMGERGYYIAFEDDKGRHMVPDHGGSTMGFNLELAEKILSNMKNR